MAEASPRKSPGNWIKPKADHYKFVNGLIQCSIHLVLCFRSREKIRMVPNPENPNKQIVEHMGWQPICGKKPAL